VSGLTCLLCGRVAGDVRMALVRYAAAHQADGKPFGSMPRCSNVDECQARTEANGDAWPLNDGPDLPTQGVALRVGRRVTPQSQEAIAGAFVPVVVEVLNAEEVEFE
jgi:hypothetical protein